MVPAPPVPPSPTIATPSAADPGALLERAAEEALRLVRADGAFACLIDGPGTVLRFAGEAGTGSRRERAWASALADPANSALTRRAVAERRLTATSDYRTDATFDSPAGSDAAVGRLGLRSLVVVPLVGPEDGAPVMGALGVFADEPSAFDEARIALVQALADHCAASLANARLIAELASSREELARTAAGERALREISSRLVAITSPGELLQRVVEAASRLVDADGAILALLDRHERVLRWSYDDGLSAAFAPEFVASLTLPIGVGPTGEAVAAERIVVVGEDLIDRFPPSPESDHFFEVTGFRSMIAAPIVGDGRPLGALEVYSKAEHAFDEAQAAQIEALAGQAAIALTNARLVEELARSRERLAQRAEAEGSLREIASRISAIRDPDAVLQYTLDEAVRLLGSDGGRIALIDDASGDLAWAYSSGAPPLDSDDLSGGNIVRREGGISGRAIADGRAFFTSDYLVDPRFVHGTAADAFVRNAGIRAAMAAPIVSEGRPLGAINLHAFRPGAYDETAASLLEALASQAAIAVSNAQLIRELGRSREENARRAEAERALREIATRLTAVRDPGELLQLVVTEAARLLSAERSQIDLIDATTGLLRWAYPREMQLEAEPAETNQSRQTGVAGRAIEIGGAFVTGDYLGDERFVHTPESDDFIRRAGLLSVIAAPLVDESGVLGVLNVGSTRRDAFGPDDAALIEALATQAALAISNARRIELLDASRAALVHRADAERSLREIASRLASYRAPAELLQYTIDAARRLLGADGGLLDLLDPATGMISWAYDSGVEDEKVRDLLRTLKLPVGSGLFGTAIARGEVVATGDYLADDRFVHMSGADAVVEAIGFRALVAAPLQGDSGPLGVLGLFSARPNAFAEADLALLAAFADAAAVAITNARLIEELNRSRSELARRAEAERTLREITARITVLHDQREVLQQVVDESKRLLGSDGAHLTLMLDDRRSLQPVVVAGGTDEESDRWLKGQRFPVGGGMNGLAAELNQPISTVDYLVDPRIPHEPDDQEVAQRLGLRAMAVAPLRALEGEVIGTLAISYDEPRAIADEELQLLQGLADQAAIAVTNLRLYDLQAESETRYRHLVQNSPDLVWAIDGEGRFTFVSDTCERLTGWQPDDLLGQHFGALVHPDSDDVALRDWTEGAVGPVQELRGRLGLRHRDGRAVPAEFNALARYEDGRFVGANGAVRDMTEL
ncbi:MAG TPA: GAF domain-containing protein, partial [Candidatus Limnocylindrales bacterium]